MMNWKRTTPFSDTVITDPKQISYRDPKSGKNMEVTFDLAKVDAGAVRQARGAGVDRWRAVLPIDADTPSIPLLIGDTPLYDSKPVAQETGFAKIYIKDDGRNPSASFKDRAGAAALMRAMNLGIDTIVCASTGNAASSLACLAAAVKIRTLIFVPASAPEAKIAQLLVFGANVFAVDGSYDDACALSEKATREFGLYNRNTGLNPFTREGKKLCAYELAWQLNWDVPDYMIIAVGDGNIISGIAKGFVELKGLGLTKQIPKMIAAQSDKSNAIALALESGKLNAVRATTIADSISVDYPQDGDMAVHYIKKTGGFGVQVSDGEILDAIPWLARQAGVFAEPAAACAAAALRKCAKQNLIPKDARVGVLVSGNGLKDVKSARESIKGKSEPVSVNAETAMSRVAELLKR